MEIIWCLVGPTIIDAFERIIKKLHDGIFSTFNSEKKIFVADIFDGYISETFESVMCATLAAAMTSNIYFESIWG